jgi:hypothetical protein
MNCLHILNFDSHQIVDQYVDSIAQVRFLASLPLFAGLVKPLMPFGTRIFKKILASPRISRNLTHAN